MKITTFEMTGLFCINLQITCCTVLLDAFILCKLPPSYFVSHGCYDLYMCLGMLWSCILACFIFYVCWCLERVMTLISCLEKHAMLFST